MLEGCARLQEGGSGSGQGSGPCADRSEICCVDSAPAHRACVADQDGILPCCFAASVSCVCAGGCCDLPWKLTAVMSTAMWPPIDEDRLAQEQAASQARELEWLLVQLRETLQSLKAGLDECAALLAPSENGSTLVLTSVRSESLKGLITRIGTRITKGVGHGLVVDVYSSTYSLSPEHQAPPRKPPTAKGLVDLGPRHLLCTACTYTRCPSAYFSTNLHQQLSRRHRCRYLGRRRDQRPIRLGSTPTATRPHNRGTGCSQRPLACTALVVG